MPPVLFSLNVFLIGVALLAIAAFSGYRWYQVQRTERIGTWIRKYLSDRYGQLPDPLSIQCTDDTHWPVLVAFRTANGQTRHRLQFACARATSRFALVSHVQEDRSSPHAR